MIPSTCFTPAEQTCQCGCAESCMDSGFIRLLEQLRTTAGIAFPVTSAYRCPDHNSRVSSTGRTGPHTTGRAVDIRAGSRAKFKIAKACFEYDQEFPGLIRLGIAKTFIHIDNLGGDPDFDSDVICTY